MQTDNFIFAKAEGNYCQIHIIKDDKVEMALLRLTMNQLESQISDKERIFRCHRSYLINLHHFESVQGNAQGYKVYLNYERSGIPIARGKSRVFEKLIENL